MECEARKTQERFRTTQVHVGSGRRYIPPPPGDALIGCINDLDAFLGNHADKYSPLVLEVLVHYQFEEIYLFPDGNGRIGRLLLALTTLRSGASFTCRGST